MAGGHADCSVKVAAVESARVLESTTAVHSAPVVCLALSPDGATLVFGGLRWAAPPLARAGPSGARSWRPRSRARGQCRVLLQRGAA